MGPNRPGYPESWEKTLYSVPTQQISFSRRTAFSTPVLGRNTALSQGRRALCAACKDFCRGIGWVDSSRTTVTYRNTGTPSKSSAPPTATVNGSSRVWPARATSSERRGSSDRSGMSGRTRLFLLLPYGRDLYLTTFLKVTIEPGPAGSSFGQGKCDGTWTGCME